MATIHPTAILGKNVRLGKDNEIGPYAIVEDGVTLGDHNILGSHIRLCKGVTLGSENRVHMGAIVGHEPQDLAYKGHETFTVIGDRNTIREYATIHRGTREGSETRIGDDCFLMAYTHVAHNCTVGNNVIMVNMASLTGHCVVEDGAFLSGMTGFHQHTRIGKLAMVSALSAANRDIPPYAVCGGRPAHVFGINVVGLRRAGVDAEERLSIKRAYKILYQSGLNMSQALQAIEKELHSPAILHLVQFIRTAKRGICNYASYSAETADPVVFKNLQTVEAFEEI